MSSTPKPPLSLEVLQANLRRLADRLTQSTKVHILTTSGVSAFLQDLADGCDGDDVADVVELSDEELFENLEDLRH